MSSTSKGKAFENFTADQMRQMGIHIMYKSVRMRFGAIDFDGVWDIVGAKPLKDGVVEWWFVQCKSKRMYGKEMQPYSDWLQTYGFKGINCFVAVKTKNGRRTAIEWHKVA